MQLAIAGILLIVGLLGSTAFLAGKEHLRAMRLEDEIAGRDLRRVPLPARLH